MFNVSREQELIENGLVDAIRQQYTNTNYNIQEKYFILIADYIDSINQLEFDDCLYLNVMDVAKMLPSVLNQVIERNIVGIHGRTDDNIITMNSSLDYETNKLYFFMNLHTLLKKEELM